MSIIEIPTYKTQRQTPFAAANLSQTMPLTISALKSNPGENTGKYFTVHTLALSILKHKARAPVVFTMSYNIQQDCSSSEST